MIGFGGFSPVEGFVLSNKSVSTMAERNAWFTLCTLEVVGDGVGFENSVEGSGAAGVDARGWFEGLLLFLLIPR